MTKNSKIKKQTNNLYKVEFTITHGEALALKHALEYYSQNSAVADDVKGYLKWACHEANIDLESF